MNEFEKAIKKQAKSLSELIQENAKIWNAGEYQRSSNFSATIYVPSKVVLAEYAKAEADRIVTHKDLVHSLIECTNAYNNLKKVEAERKQQLQQFYDWLKDWSNDGVVKAKFAETFLSEGSFPRKESSEA